jgi:hypothetical protein
LLKNIFSEKSFFLPNFEIVFSKNTDKQNSMRKNYNYDLEKKISDKSSEASPIKNVVADMLEKFKLKSKFTEISIAEAWRKTLGENVSNRTQKLVVKDRKIFVKLESASLKNEILMNKNLIISRLNQAIGENAIDELVFN